MLERVKARAGDARKVRGELGVEYGQGRGRDL